MAAVWDRNDILAASVDPESGPVVMFHPLDYERARACVNACAGMDDPAHGIRETVALADRMTRKAFDAENHRDQLLAALQRLLRERAMFGRPKPGTWAETAAMLDGMGVQVYMADADDVD